LTGLFDIRTMLTPNDLLILASPYADFFRIVHSFADPTTVEARLDRRHGRQRRRSAARAAAAERRRRDRRSRDIRHQLHTIGWAFVPAAERNK
jgi:hypothetical protein